MTPTVAIVIPTRNRADLAIAAIQSLLAIAGSRLQIIVSNNSSEPEHVQTLEKFCERLAEPRLLHLRPARALSMADHWDWAIEQTLARSDATHLALHYDRRISRPELSRLLELSARWPECAITYPIDFVYPAPQRFRLQPRSWSGNLYEIRTSRALELAARGSLTNLWEAFPVLVNCITPRSVFERIRSRFGDVCASTSPESCFGFRYCALEERYLHLDRPLGIHYAYERSNGMAYLRGEESGTFADFVSLLGDRPWLDAAPIPGLSLGQNIFYHEYETLRRSAGKEKFPPIEMRGYLNDLGRWLPWIPDPVRRAAMRDLLVKHGWREDEEIALPAPSARVRLRDRLSRKWKSLAAHPPPVPPTPPDPLDFELESDALHHALMQQALPSAENDTLAPLEPIRIPT